MINIEIVNLEERARTSIALGESHFREFKSALHGKDRSKAPRNVRSICRDIAEALVAFANADGGELLIGVEDDGTISGIDYFSETEYRTMVRAPITHIHQKTPLPPHRIAALTLNGHRVLYFSTNKSTAHVHLTSDGRCVQRRDLETVPIPAEEIILGRRERMSLEYDRQYVDAATAHDLNSGLVQVVATQISPGMTIEKCLQYLDLAEYMGPGLRIRKGALLLFAKEPNRWHPRLQLRIVKIEGIELKTGADYNVTLDQTVTGNILELIDKGWEALRPQLVQTRLGTDARFSNTVMYPELACREALVNAVSHRDYSEEGRGVEVFIFDDRMEVRNPGALLSSITVSDLLELKGVHQSRNSIVSRVLREVGYMRELGEGMRRMFALMKQNELTDPEIISDSNSFCVILRHKTIYSPEEVLWLDNFQAYSLTREQKAIVVLGLGGRLISPQDIWDRLGIVDTDHYRQLIESLRELQLIRSEIPKTRAYQEARRKKIPIRNVARIRVLVPAQKVVSDARVSGLVVSKSSEDREDGPNIDAQLWIGNLPLSVKDSELVEFFNQFGDVQSCYIPRNVESGNTRGYAFVEFDSERVVVELLGKMEPLRFRGRSLVVRKANPKRSK